MLKIYTKKIVGLMLISLVFVSVSATAQIAVTGETVYTMSGEAIKNGVVLIGVNGKIEAVRSATGFTVPQNYKKVLAKVVTPGLIDARTVVGLNGYLNQPNDQMALEASSAMQPELRAIDSYNPEERLIEWLRGFGITTIQTGHQPSALISGQMMIAKTIGKTVEDVTINPSSMISVTLGDSAIISGGRSPGTRAKQASMLREMLLKASNYKGEPRDLKLEMMQKVIKREIPLLVNANKSQDIITAIRIAKEFNIRIVLDGASEAHLVIPQIKEAGISVIVHPTMQRAGGETENLTLENAAKLKNAGILIAIQSGFEGYVPKTRVVLFEAAIAAANGLSFRDALASITIDAAKILGIDKQVGSLEAGKDGDIALYDGDPFEYTSHCIGTIINGKIVSEAVR
jgi:imidazolonepropionase-like amidohydrolase